MKAIIVAAGRGRRLGHETADIPKCMVSVGNRPIIEWQLAALRAAGVDDVVIVRGYLGDRIRAPGARFVENPAWQTNNILASLFHAEGEMEDGFLFSYSDIVFAPDTAKRLAASTGDVALVVDRRWAETYEGRMLHPVGEAELARVEEIQAGGLRITRVGKQAVPATEAAGEFIGLAKFSAAGASALRRAWTTALARGLDTPYGLAPTLRTAYVTDALNDIASTGTDLVPVFTEGRWREIDTEEDLARAHAVVSTW